MCLPVKFIFIILFASFSIGAFYSFPHTLFGFDSNLELKIISTDNDLLLRSKDSFIIVQITQCDHQFMSDFIRKNKGQRRRKKRRSNFKVYKGINIFIHSGHHLINQEIINQRNITSESIIKMNLLNFFKSKLNLDEIYCIMEDNQHIYLGDFKKSLKDKTLNNKKGFWRNLKSNDTSKDKSNSIRQE